MGDIDGSSKRAKIQPLLDLLYPAFESAYTPDQDVAIDEAIINFKGRVSFRLY